MNETIQHIIHSILSQFKNFLKFKKAFIKKIVDLKILIANYIL